MRLRGVLTCCSRREPRARQLLALSGLGAAGERVFLPSGPRNETAGKDGAQAISSFSWGPSLGSLEIREEKLSWKVSTKQAKGSLLRCPP
ncbi:hypothetical protein DTO166G4_1345 [Paecilomyces variotii]|nr:hypothetical protein DTO032I3_780 [Paecilomyces variotii]KAJ9216885.1 hypothetical protein DTO166G4_1345 [Paecilomyces variotii]KAJ9218748.1 hypothetical protein DTO169C6_8896 [Paecilomyces variotii]KAJ9231009.1 hypothetical protein DTO169E5_8177 [Paecilomyces variotii]KAJ9242775.1 hypothetical protein DTO166G5_530 [Paecilomyces variotii]